MAGELDTFEVARFVTVPEAELAADFLRRHDIHASLPDRDTATMRPDLLFAMGGVRVIAPGYQIAEARRLIARMRAGEFLVEGDDDGEWREAATPGKIGELDEAEVTGVIGQAKKAGIYVILVSFVLFPLAGCLLSVFG